MFAGLEYAAGCHPLRRQATETLIKDVLPWVLRMVPDSQLQNFKLHIVGANIVPEELKQLFKLNREFVKFHGHLNNTEVRPTHSLLVQSRVRSYARACQGPRCARPLSPVGCPMTRVGARTGFA